MRPHSLPAGSHRFVGMARETAAMPPACKEGNNNKRSFRCVTHTHTPANAGFCPFLEEPTGSRLWYRKGPSVANAIDADPQSASSRDVLCDVMRV